MNIRMGSQVFANVEIPLLWGKRAVLQDAQGRLSVLNLSGESAQPEIISDEPAPGVGFRPRVNGFVILEGGHELYSYDPKAKLLSSVSLGSLPDVEITPGMTRVGGAHFGNNVVLGFPVGILVSENGIGLGAPLPKELAKLVV